MAAEQKHVITRRTAPHRAHEPRHGFKRMGIQQQRGERTDTHRYLQPCQPYEHIPQLIDAPPDPQSTEREAQNKSAQHEFE